jgi:hypothetical protein
LSFSPQVLDYLSAPLWLFVTSRDTNVNGGVEALKPGATDCKNTPNLKNNRFTISQGPYRLARAISCFTTARAVAQSLEAAFTWGLAVCPGVGHDSIADAHCLQLYHGLFSDDSKNATGLTEVILNPSFKKEFFRLETIPGTLPCVS